MKTRNTSKDNEWTKVASRPLFNLYRHTAEPHLWQVRLKASGGYLRRRFHALDLGAALLEAPKISGLLPPEASSQTFSVVEAMEMALQATTRRETSRSHWRKDTERFLAWLQKRYPLCVEWRQLTRAILREYLATLEGNAPNTKRIRFQPMLQTAGFMSREYGFPNIGERMGLSKKLKRPPRSVYLEDVVSFCDWLRENVPHLEVGACLQGLAGLQLLEALRLTWDKVDLETGLIEISGEVKNEYRNRVIPVMGRVLDALRRRRASWCDLRASQCRVLPMQEPVAVGTRGDRYHDYTAYGRQMRAALLKWNVRCDWAPKDLRNCLPTFAAMNGLQGALWEQYIGHAPETVTARHYVPRLTSWTAGERSALNGQMDLFRRLVVDHLETRVRALASPETCNFLQLTPGGVS